MEVHFVPFEGQYLIYAPLKRLAFVGNRALVEYLRARTGSLHAAVLQPQIEAFLSEVGFTQPESLPSMDDVVPVARPSTAVLLMTNRCNLACTYCYADAGSQPPADLAWPVARKVIDQAIANAQANGEPRFGLSLHGGGEPTLNWEVLVQAIEHVRAASLPCEVSLASNGVWSEKVTDYICRNINSVTLSFDGVQAVQDAQRPRLGCQGSFDAVVQSIRALDAAGVSYGIRMTVLSDSVDRLSDSIRFLCLQTGVRAVQVEPSFTVSRGVYADPSAHEAERFARAFLEAARVGAQHQVFVTYSGARPWVVSNAFCLAPTRALIVTPEGRLVGCFEATGDGHPYADEFTIGHATAERVEYDGAAFARFQQRLADRRAACEGCFCFRHCCGDCASRGMVSPAPDSVRCEINRSITKSLILSYIQRDRGVWRGVIPLAKVTKGRKPPCPTCP